MILERIKKRTSIAIALLACLSFQNIRAIQIESNIQNDNKYGVLVDKFYENVTDSSLASFYASKYLNLAKKEKDTFKIMNGYYFFSIFNQLNLSLKYSDSILEISNNKNHSSKDYPARAYLSKAMIFYDNGDFKSALDYFINVNKEALKYNDQYLLFTSNNSIGILKSRLGENKASLKILKESFAFFSKEKTTYPSDYLATIFALADSYIKNKKLDSALIFNKLGYKESLRLNNADMTNYFTLNEGVNKYFSKNYTIAKDSLEKAIPELHKTEDMANLSIARYYLGKTLFALGSKDKAIEQFVKVDEIVKDISEIMPETRSGYEFLINHFKEQNDTENQLKYIERLIVVDSILYSNYKYLIKNIAQNYDTAQLISDKEEIINSLMKEKKQSNITNIIAFIICVILILFLGLNYQKRKIYKKRFLKLYEQKQNNHSSKKEITEKSVIDIGISVDIINEILDKLDFFESNTGFTKPKLTLSKLSKEFGTNPRYLSKVINTHKGKSFNNYINDLRINFVVEKLKSDFKFRKYTIKAIGNEIGFSSTEVFSKSFYKSTGVYPSYFLKQLEKANKN